MISLPRLNLPLESDNIPSQNLEDESELKLFDSYECAATKLATKFIMNMEELSYITFDSEFGTMKFTNSGLNYLKAHGDEIKYFIKKNKLQLTNFGPMASYFTGLFQDLEKYNPQCPIDPMRLNNSNILDSKDIVTEMGTIVTDMNTVTFVNKAPGDIGA